MAKQSNLLPPKKRDAVKQGVATGEKGKAFKQKEPGTDFPPQNHGISREEMQRKMKELSTAVENSDVDEVKRLLTEGTSINFRLADDRSLDEFAKDKLEDAQKQLTAILDDVKRLTDPSEELSRMETAQKKRDVAQRIVHLLEEERLKRGQHQSR